MAENQDGQEKSQEPTGKRIEDARKKGQVPRSRELNTMAITLLGAAIGVGAVLLAGCAPNGPTDSGTREDRLPGEWLAGDHHIHSRYSVGWNTEVDPPALQRVHVRMV